MKQQKNFVLLIALLMLGFVQLQAQESTNSAGGNASSGSGSISYSVGQVTYQTIANANGSVAQGVQQPYEIWIVSGIEDAKDITLDVKVYPNPAQDFLVLKLNQYATQGLSYQLLDMNGKILRKQAVNEDETQINMNNLAPALYLLKIYQSGHEIKTFKIIKN